jgi:hypothetical protein
MALKPGPKLKTHCKRGHAFVPDNLRYVKLSSGYTVRACKRCRATRDSLRYHTDITYQAAKRARENVRNALRRGKEI